MGGDVFAELEDDPDTGTTTSTLAFFSQAFLYLGTALFIGQYLKFDESTSLLVVACFFSFARFVCTAVGWLEQIPSKVGRDLTRPTSFTCQRCEHHSGIRPFPKLHCTRGTGCRSFERSPCAWPCSKIWFTPSGAGKSPNENVATCARGAGR